MYSGLYLLEWLSLETCRSEQLVPDEVLVFWSPCIITQVVTLPLTRRSHRYYQFCGSNGTTAWRVVFVVGCRRQVELVVVSSRHGIEIGSSLGVVYHTMW